MPNKAHGTSNIAKIEKDSPKILDSDDGIKDSEYADQKGSQEQDK